MLSDLHFNSPPPAFASQMNAVSDDRYSRNMEEDMKEAIGLLFKLKAGLDKLHPGCLRMIENMMNQPNHY